MLSGGGRHGGGPGACEYWRGAPWLASNARLFRVSAPELGSFSPPLPLLCPGSSAARRASRPGYVGDSSHDNAAVERLSGRIGLAGGFAREERSLTGGVQGSAGTCDRLVGFMGPLERAIVGRRDKTEQFGATMVWEGNTVIRSSRSCTGERHEGGACTAGRLGDAALPIFGT